MGEFKGRPVRVLGDGQCETCKRRVWRVLIENSAPMGHTVTRTWHTVEFGEQPYQPHVCPVEGGATRGCLRPAA